MSNGAVSGGWNSFEEVILKGASFICVINKKYIGNIWFSVEKHVFIECTFFNVVNISFVQYFSVKQSTEEVNRQD